MFLMLLEFGSMIIATAFAVTQIIVPLFKDTKLFPMLRRQAKLENELSNVRQEAIEKELEERVADERRRAQVRSVKK